MARCWCRDRTFQPVSSGLAIVWHSSSIQYADRAICPAGRQTTHHVVGSLTTSYFFALGSSLDGPSLEQRHTIRVFIVFFLWSVPLQTPRNAHRPTVSTKRASGWASRATSTSSTRTSSQATSTTTRGAPPPWSSLRSFLSLIVFAPQANLYASTLIHCSAGHCLNPSESTSLDFDTPLVDAFFFIVLSGFFCTQNQALSLTPNSLSAPHFGLFFDRPPPFVDVAVNITARSKLFLFTK
jgi:hypothetical protein